MANSTSSDDGDEPESLIQRALSATFLPVRLAISRPAIKAYLSTLLFLLASCTLLTISTTAYLVFYYAYIPQVSLWREIHLQYGLSPHPYATVPLSTVSTGTAGLSSQQPYDISLEVHLPRTPNNLAAGNFMLELTLLSPSANPPSTPSALSAILPNASTTLATSRRPAIIPYSSPLLSLTSTLLSLPLHILSFRDLDTSTLNIPMFERISFARGWRNVPAAVKVEVQSDSCVLQVYSARVVFRARFEGLRYLVYNYRFLSWAVFSAAFYVIALGSMASIWAVVSLLLFPEKKEENFKTEISDEAQRKGAVKTEDEKATTAELSNGHIKSLPPADTKMKIELDEENEESALSLSALSDTPTTFPTLSRQMPLRFPVQQTPSNRRLSGGIGRTSGIDVKRESPHPSSERTTQDTAIEPLSARSSEPRVQKGEVADDEGDEDPNADEPMDEDGYRGRSRDVRYLMRMADEDAARERERERDSGLGTSMESENAASAASVKRRTSRTFGTLRGGDGGSRSQSRTD